jgi:hypothetical protein
MKCISASFFIAFALVLHGYSYVHRLALFIGSDEGLAHERPLKYAAHDAREMAQLFKESGAFEEDRIYLLENQSITRVREAVQEISGRIKELKKREGKVLSLFYYSGHGSADALHIMGKKYSRTELITQLENLQSDLKIMIVDACESGNLLRSKGGEVIMDHSIQKVDNLNNKGTIVLSSSSRGELAQESENYRGAIFTHHLINGLRGVADYNNDLEVSLWEAFNYASVSTRSENIMGKINQQNPSFDFDVVGRSDIILTSLHKKKSRLLLRGFGSTVMEVHDAGSMDLEARILLSGRDSIHISLPSKEYLLTYEKGRRFNVSKVDLSWGQVVAVTPSRFKALSKTEVYRKGGMALNPHAMRYSYTLAKLGPGDAVPMIQGHYVLRGYRFKQLIGLGWGAKKQAGELRTSSRHVLRVSYSIQKPLLRYRFGQFLIGVETAWYRSWQTLTDTRFDNAPVNPYADEIEKERVLYSNLYEAAVPVEKEFYVPWGFLISVTAHTGVCVYKDGSGDYISAIGFRPVFSVGYKF